MRRKLMNQWIELFERTDSRKWVELAITNLCVEIKKANHFDRQAKKKKKKLKYNIINTLRWF